MVLTWLRSRFSRRTRKTTRRTPAPRYARTRLGTEELETRLTPSGTALLGGLEFYTDGAFTTTSTASGNVISTTSPVKVGVAPSAGNTFNPLLQLDGGVQFLDGDPTGSFTTNGTVEATVANQSIPLLDGGSHTFAAGDLLGGTGTVSGGKDISVAGVDFVFSDLRVTDHDVELQGSLTIPKLDGLTLGVNGSNAVVLDGAGVHLTGLDASLSGVSFKTGGVQFNADALNVHYSAPTATTDAEFDLSGSGSATILGKNVGLDLGTPQAPGLVIDNGQLQQLDAKVTTPTVTVGAVTLNASSLELTYTAPSAANNNTDTFSLTGAAGLAVGGNTLNLQLGDTQEGTQGLVIENGQLTSLDAAVSGEVDVAGIKLHSDGLRATYQAASVANGNTDTVTITGAADFSLKGNTVNLQLGDTQEGTKGIVIQNGQLTNLDAAVTGHIDIAGLEINADALRATYQAPGSANGNTETITVTGSADFALNGNTVSLQLGNSTYPQGLVIQNGQLANLDASVSADFSLFGLSVKATDLGVHYAAATATAAEQIDIFGSLSVSTSDGHLQGIGANLGTVDNPGLELVGGQLTHLNIGLTGSFSLFGVTIASDSLTVAYDSGTHLLNLTGGATVSLTSAISGSVNFPDGGLTIDTATGAVQVNGLELKFDVTFGGFGIHDLDIKYTSVNGDTTFSASGSVELPGGFAVGGSLALHNGQLTDIALSFDAGSGAGIPLGDTGLFITHVDGGLHHLDNLSQLTVDAGLGITFGEKVSFLGHSYSLFDVYGHITVSARELDLTGTINILGGVYGTGTASLKLDWTHQVYSVTLHVGIYDSTITLDGSFLINGNGDISLQATASAQLPATIGNLFGNHSFLTGTADLEIHPTQDASHSFVDITVAVPGVGQAELKYDFANHLHIDAHASLLGQTAELVGDVNPDGTFQLHGAINVSILGSTLVGTINADNNGFHANGTLNLLGQTVTVHGDVWSNGTFNLSGTVHINAGVQFDAGFTADNNGFHASGQFYALGTTVYVHGDFWSNGRFALAGYAWIDVAGSWAYATFNADNNGVHVGGTFYVLGQSVYVHGDFYASGYFNLSGAIWINIIGNSAYVSFSADNNGFHASGWASILGQSVYVYGDIYSSGWYNFGGSVWINAAGIWIDANFSADNNGLHVNTWANFLGQSVNVWGDVYYGGWFDFHGSIWLGFCGVGISASVDVNPNGVHLDAWVGFCGVGIEVWGNVYSDGTFSIGTTWWNWSIWIDNWGFHASWNW